MPIFTVRRFSKTPRLKTTLSILSAVMTALICQAPASSSPPEKSWKTGYILVKPKAGLAASELKNILKRNNAQSLGVIGTLDVHLVNVPENGEAVVVRALSKNPHIDFAELDVEVEPGEFIPNDPQYGNAWHLPKIEAANAWDHSTAESITIAILDTGVDAAHPDLFANMVPGWNAVDGSSNTSDIQGHGTAVAGTAAATGNNATGIASIAWNAQIMPVRISNRSDGNAYFSDIARGLNWAADHGADVANISYGVTGSSTVTSAAHKMRDKGGVVVVAGGNDGSDPGITDNPDIITVSATTSSDSKASWSNYGNFIDVGAPGVSILTTSRGGGYGNWSGTSFASPAAAGVVALIMGANPSLSPNEIEFVLESSADQVAGGWHPYYGNGRVNAASAVQLALDMGQAPVDSEPPVVDIFSPDGGATVAGVVLVEVNASDNVRVHAVTLFANGQPVGTDFSVPYQFSWDSRVYGDGPAILTAIAEDTSGISGESEERVVFIANHDLVDDQDPPTVRITSPVDGANVSGVITIEVSAEDNDTVELLELYIDGVLRTSIDGGSLIFSWNTRKVSGGTHTIEAIAYDRVGNSDEQSLQVLVGGKSSMGGGKGKK